MMILMNGTGQRLIFKAQPQVEKKYIYIKCKVSSGRVGPAVFKLDNGSGIL
jgi:hypothetical protein